MRSAGEIAALVAAGVVPNLAYLALGLWMTRGLGLVERGVERWALAFVLGSGAASLGILALRAFDVPIPLLALAAVQRGQDRFLRFAEIEERLKKLLIDFGPPRKSYHPEYPFWRLQNDGDFWEIPERGHAIELRGDMGAPASCSEKEPVSTCGPRWVLIVTFCSSPSSISGRGSSGP